MPGLAWRGIAVTALMAAMTPALLSAQTRATKAEIADAIVGKPMTITSSAGDSGSARYGADGRFHYKDQFGTIDETYEISDGTICFHSGGKTHCEAVFKQGRGFILVDESGHRFALIASPP